MKQIVELLVLLSAVATISLSAETNPQNNEILDLFNSSTQEKEIAPFVINDHNKSPNVHIVQSSDTMFHISQIYKISLKELYAINKMDEGSKIRLGDKIRLSMPKKNTKPDIKNDGLSAKIQFTSLLPTVQSATVQVKKIEALTKTALSSPSYLENLLESCLRVANSIHISKHSNTGSDILKHSKLLFPDKAQLVALSMSAKLKVESDFNPKALAITPKEHSVGLFQVQIKTAIELAQRKDEFKSLDPELYALLNAISKNKDRAAIEKLLFVQKNNIMVGIGYEYLLHTIYNNQVQNGTIDSKSYNAHILNSLKRFKTAYLAGKIKVDSEAQFPKTITPELDKILTSFFVKMYATTSKYNGGTKNDRYVWKTATAIVQLHYSKDVEQKLSMAEDKQNKPLLAHNTTKSSSINNTQT